MARERVESATAAFQASVDGLRRRLSFDVCMPSASAADRLAAEVSDSGEEMQSVQSREVVRRV
jgi:hypothetical protein